MKNKITNSFPVLTHFNAPNVITTMGMVFGIIACFFLTQRDLRMAIFALFIAGVMDLLDGYVASKLKQQTVFGRHLDSLVDFFICCIIPIWMVFDLLGSALWIVIPMIFYCLCGLWRLANYNITTKHGKAFTGLPVPGAMLCITVAIWFVVQLNIWIGVASITFVVIGVLMISGISLPKYGLWQKIMGVGGLAFVLHVLMS